jgi:hypothetical protein
MFHADGYITHVSVDATWKLGKKYKDVHVVAYRHGLAVVGGPHATMVHSEGGGIVEPVCNYCGEIAILSPTRIAMGTTFLCWDGKVSYTPRASTISQFVRDELGSWRTDGEQVTVMASGLLANDAAGFVATCGAIVQVTDTLEPSRVTWKVVAEFDSDVYMMWQVPGAVVVVSRDAHGAILNHAGVVKFSLPRPREPHLLSWYDSGPEFATVRVNSQFYRVDIGTGRVSRDHEYCVGVVVTTNRLAVTVDNMGYPRHMAIHPI